MSEFIDKLRASREVTQGLNYNNIRSKVHHRQRARNSQTLDLAGQRFGRLVASHLADYPYGVFDNSKTWWVCRCDCGCNHAVSAGSLVSGATKSCGCLQSEIASQVIRENNRKRARKYPYKGEDLTIAELAKIGNLHPNTVRYRIEKQGKTAEEAIENKPRPKQLELALWS